MSDDLPSGVTFEAACEQLEGVLESRAKIAQSIDELVEHLPPERRRAAISLARRLRSGITPRHVLTDSEALSVCLPLMQQVATSDAGQELSDWQIDEAVRGALFIPTAPVPPSRRLASVLAYPTVMLLAGGGLVIGFCLFLVPQFEAMFDEFGLSLPATTSSLVALSHLVRSWFFIPLLVILLGGTVALVFAIRWRKKGGFLDGVMTSGRAACGTWAWHVALLLDLGFSQADAIATAGRGSCKRWLRDLSARWAEEARQGAQPLATVKRVHGQAVQMVSCAFGLSDVEDQSAMLKETALMYWERGGTVSRWWWGWLTPAAVLFVAGFCGYMVIALFAPLLELISGLT